MALKFLVNIGSGNGLLPSQHQAITWINDVLLKEPYEQISVKYE